MVKLETAESKASNLDMEVSKKSTQSVSVNISFQYKASEITRKTSQGGLWGENRVVKGM